MTQVERVRVKPTSKFAHDWQIPPEAVGEVICRYQMPARCAAPRDRLDVFFTANTVIWGGPADDFEIVSESAQPPRQPAG